MTSYLRSYMDTIPAVPMNSSDLICVHSMFHLLYDNVESISKNLWKMISADVEKLIKTIINKDLVAASYKFL